MRQTRRCWRLLATGIILGWVDAVGAQMIELEAVDDSFVDQASPDENYGSGPAFSTLWVWPAAREAVAYLKFDLSALRPDAVITHARLYLYQTRGAGFAPIGTRAYRLEDDAWSEDTLTFANQPWVFGAPLPLLGFNPHGHVHRGWTVWDLLDGDEWDPAVAPTRRSSAPRRTARVTRHHSSTPRTSGSVSWLPRPH